jgi:hypothetical protein
VGHTFRISVILASEDDLLSTAWSEENVWAIVPFDALETAGR